MKSSFILSLVVMAFLAKPVFAQTTRKLKQIKPTATAPAKPVKTVKPTTSTPVATAATPVVEKSSFDKFYDRLKVGYFGAFSGSSLGEWDEKAMDEKGIRSSGYVHNVWNQLSFNYNFGAKMNFVINPRWMLNTGATHGANAKTRGVLSMEDWLVGFQGVIISAFDKKLNLWTRPGIRLPTSRLSRENDITMQPEALSILSYDIDKTWQLGMFQQLRHWVYEQRYTSYRYRLFHAPYIQYAWNDKNRLQLYYEHYLENRSRLPSQNGKSHNLQDYWQNAMLAWSSDITPKLGVMPFIGYILDTNYATQRPLEPAWLGAWIFYTIK
jgi:hypothetical protein